MRTGGESGERQRRERQERGEIVRCILYTFIYFHIPLYIFIYLHIPSHTSKYPKYLYIPLYNRIYLKISNIRKMRANIRHTNGNNSGPRAFPESEFDTRLPTMSPLCHTQRGPILVKFCSFKKFWGVIQVHNPINRAPRKSLVERSL